MTYEREKIIGLLKATFSVAVWGASFIATKVALRDVSPITVVWLRFAMGILLLGVFVLLRREFFLPPSKELGYFALVGFIGITFHQWLQSNGLITAQASTSAWIVSTSPIFIAVLGWLFLKEKLRWDQIFGIAVAAVGALLVVSKGNWGSLLKGSFGTPGDFLILISSPNWAVASVLSRKGLKKHTASGMMFYVMILGWLFTSLHFFTYGNIGEIVRLTLSGWTSVGFLGIFCSGLAYLFWFDALKVIPASQVGALLYIEPLFAVIVAAAILNENITLGALLGGAIILLGVWMVTRK